MSLRSGDTTVTVTVQESDGSLDATGSPTFGVSQDVEVLRVNVTPASTEEIPYPQPATGTVVSTYRLTGMDTNPWPGGPYSAVSFQHYGQTIKAQQRGALRAYTRGSGTRHWVAYVDQMQHEVK